MHDVKASQTTTPRPIPVLSSSRRLWPLGIIVAVCGLVALLVAGPLARIGNELIVVGLVLLSATLAALSAVLKLRRTRAQSTATSRLHSIESILHEGTQIERQSRTTLYGVLLVLCTNFGLQTWHTHKTEQSRLTENAAIELAAVQRMLSQRIARLAVAPPMAGADPSASDMLEAIRRSDEDASRLGRWFAHARGSDGPAPIDLEHAWQTWLDRRAALVSRARSLLTSPHLSASEATRLGQEIGQRADGAMDAVQALLDAMRASTSKSHAARMKQAQMWAALNIVIVSALALVAIGPAVRSMRRQYRRLAIQALDLQRLALVAERTTNAVMIVDRRRTVTWVNQAFCRITGIHSQRAIGQDAVKLFATPAADEEAAALIQRSLGSRSGSRLQLRHRVSNGSDLWLDVDVQPLHDESGDMQGHVAVSADITELKQAQVDLKIAAIAFDSLGGIAVTDDKQRILRVNAGFTRITGYTVDEAVGKTTSQLLRSGRHDQAFYKAMWAALDRDRHWQGEIWNRRKSGEVYPQWLSISAVQDDLGKTTNYVAVFTDITEKKRADETIRSLAFFDPLTKLPNRRMLLDRISSAIEASTRTGRHAAILFIDLDNFKELNDSKGHDVGDKLLVEVGRRLSALLRADDTVARHGGDEFVVLISMLSGDPLQAARQAERIAESIQGALTRPYSLDGFRHHSSPSIGISLFLGDEHGVDQLLKRADSAMYLAKRSGRNAWRFFDPAVHAELERRVEMEADLRSAIELDQLMLHLQPQVGEDDQVSSAEVLLRWRDPTRGDVPPSQFIPIAEESDLILEVGAWVLEQAARQLVTWSERPGWSGLELAVNVSARQFRRADFAATVKEIIDRTGARADRLKLELTESLFIGDVDEVVKTMHALRGLGVKLSLDDFGTGQSSLAYLTRLPLDQLKIDQSFVRNLTLSRSDAVVVETVIGLATNLGIDVIAEGVESLEQHAILSTLGCRRYQGHLFGRPLPIAEFEQLVAKSGGGFNDPPRPTGQQSVRIQAHVDRLGIECRCPATGDPHAAVKW